MASNKVFTVWKFQNFSATFYVKLILTKLKSQNRPTLTDLAALNFHISKIWGVGKFTKFPHCGLGLKPLILKNDPHLYWPFQFTVRLCGNQIPVEPIVSSGSRMLLTYKTSEHSPRHLGFLAAYEGMKKIVNNQLNFFCKWFCKQIVYFSCLWWRT